MASDLFKLSGRVNVTAPPSVNNTADFDINVSFLEQFDVTKKLASTISLSLDVAEPVSLGDLEAAHVIMLKSTERITVLLTSTAGDERAIVVDPYMCVISLSVGYTALSFVRQPGVLTTVNLVAAQAG